MIRCEPDIVRFCDPEATENDCLIHTIELSDDRSIRQFITFWLKGANEAWKQKHRLDDHHQRDVYHRGPPWLPAQYPGKQKRGWSAHYHVDLESPPTAADLDRFTEDIPPAIWDEIQNHLKDTSHVV